MRETIATNEYVDLEEDVGTTAPPAEVRLPTLNLEVSEAKSHGLLEIFTNLAKNIAKIAPAKSDTPSQSQSQPIIHERPADGFD